VAGHELIQASNQSPENEGTPPVAPQSGEPLISDRRMLSIGIRAKRRRGPGAKEETERRRRELWEKTSRELDAIVAEYHARLPRKRATAVGAAYLRYSTRFQDSVADQLREILEHAVKLGIHVPRHLVFFDLAVRGYTNARQGLDGLRAALRRRDASVLLLFSTSRLFRKQYRTLAFVDDVHVGLNIRCIFVKSGVDTDDRDRWRSILAVQSMMDQFVVTMNVANIQAAHQGLMQKRIVFGTLSYGYSGEPLADQFTKMKKSRCKIVVDPVTSNVVQQVFRWYVDELTSINEIIRRLNDDESIPLPPKAASGEWTRLAVTRLLRNTRYRGLWRYGVCESVYLPEQDYTCQRLRCEPLKEIQFDEFRIVSDATWFAAQARLLEEGRSRGRKAKDSDRKSRPKILNGILVCPEHERALHVAGAHGRMMFCPSCHRLLAGSRALFSHLNRRLAVELICTRLAEMVLEDEALVHDILTACRTHVEEAQMPNPGRVSQLEAQADQLAIRIAFTRRTVGDSEEDQAAAAAEIKSFQNQQTIVLAELHQLKVLLVQRPKMPSEKEVQDLLAELHQVLLAAANSDLPEDTAAARELIRLLTGGRIELYQMGERRPQRGWLQARFQVPLLNVVAKLASGVELGCEEKPIEVTIDIKRPDPKDAEAEHAYALHKQGRGNVEIVAETGFSKEKVTRCLHSSSIDTLYSQSPGSTRKPKSVAGSRPSTWSRSSSCSVRDRQRRRPDRWRR